MKSGCALSHPYDNNYGHTVFNCSAMSAVQWHCIAMHCERSPHTVFNCNSDVSSALQCKIHSLQLWCNGTAHGLHTESLTVTVVALLVQQPASQAEITILKCSAVQCIRHSQPHSMLQLQSIQFYNTLMRPLGLRQKSHLQQIKVLQIHFTWIYHTHQSPGGAITLQNDHNYGHTVWAFSLRQTTHLYHIACCHVADRHDICVILHTEVVISLCKMTHSECIFCLRQKSHSCASMCVTYIAWQSNEKNIAHSHSHGCASMCVTNILRGTA